MTVEEPRARRGDSPATASGGRDEAEGQAAEINRLAVAASPADGATEEAPPLSPSVLPIGATEQDLEAIRREKR